MSASVSPDVSLHLRGVACPMNYVKSKLRLERMEPGQLLEIFIDAGAPMRNVPRSITNDGHKVVLTEEHEGGFRLLIERGAES